MYSVIWSYRDGLLKMQDVFSKNPKMGDPASLSSQLDENSHVLDKLQQEIRKYEVKTKKTLLHDFIFRKLKLRCCYLWQINFHVMNIDFFSSEWGFYFPEKLIPTNKFISQDFIALIIRVWW